MAETMTAEANDQSLTNVDTNLGGLSSISENSHPSLLREQSASPEPMEEGRSVFFDRELVRQRQDSKESPSNSPTTSGPADGREPSSFNKANRPKTQRSSGAPPSAIRNKNAEAHVSSQSQRRQSTTTTQNTQNTQSSEYSEPFEESEVWDQKAILSLDGGGIRGYSALLIIQKLMEKIGRRESAHADGPANSSYHPLGPPRKTPEEVASSNMDNAAEGYITDSSPWLPCHYFDYMAGTSTGGLIATMLGRLRMNIDDCIGEYETLGEKVFARPRSFHLRSPLFWIRDKYSAKVLEGVLEDVVSRRVSGGADFPGGKNFAYDENRCRVMVISYQKTRVGGVNKPYLFRTYANLHKSDRIDERQFDRNPAQAHDIPIWQVARATSAAPTYFRPVVIDGLEYIDGGFGANNPCAEIYDEVKKMNNNAEKCVYFILSVGTGKNNKLTRFQGQGLGRYWNYLNFARKWATDSEKTHDQMIKNRNNSTFKFHYYRLNVEEGLDSMKLDEWRARGPVKRKVGSIIGKYRAKPSGAVAQQTQASLDEKAQPQNRRVLSDIGATQNGNHPVGNAPSESEREDANEPDPAPVITEKGARAFSRMNGASSEELSDPITLTAIPRWLRPKNRTLKNIRKHTMDYLERDDVQRKLEECAEKLVEGRRKRAESNPDRWERTCYSYSTWYACAVEGCQRAENKYPHRKNMEGHLKSKHRDILPPHPNGLENMLESCKIIVH